MKTQQEYQRKYRASEKGRAARLHYQRSPERRAAGQRYDHSEKGKMAKRANQLKRLYGLSTEEYNIRLHNQNNKCACCESPFHTLPRVDHDHLTGRIRGLVCNACNMGVGLLKDSIEGLQVAMDYLAVVSAQQTYA